jgi:hypothetical protein
MGRCWSRLDKIHNGHGADLADSECTDAGRTKLGSRLAFMKKSQVSGYSDGPWPTACKTVGSAYVGSNPTPATTTRDALWPAHAWLEGVLTDGAGSVRAEDVNDEDQGVGALDAGA